MKKQNFDRQWTLSLGKTSNSGYEEIGRITVDLPHDYSIGQKRDPASLSGACGGFFPGGVLEYEKVLFVPADWKGKKVMLEFEGVYMNSAVHFNHQLIACHPYGYTTFHCDLTPYLVFDEENILRVTVNNDALPNSRWYSGTGIYRHVWLMVGESVHIVPWGVYSVTPVVSEASSEIVIRTTAENNESSPVEVMVRSTLLDHSGSEITSDETVFRITGKNTGQSEQTLLVKNAKLWSLDNPYLYTLKSEIVRNVKTIDTVETKIGIRSISFDPKNGFMLNGVSMKLKGGCIHHDCGILGSASYDRAEERKVELHKESGFNALRCAHNPPSPAFLDACDRIGMLVIDEAFDCWREGKNPYDYSLFFEDWWQRDIEAMVCRDRNHPSIIMWSTGNELDERDGRSDGYKYARLVSDHVRKFDNTRAVTNALSELPVAEPLIAKLIGNVEKITEDYDYWGELSEKFAEPLDVVGYNYMYPRYESDSIRFQDRIILGTESTALKAFENWEAVEKSGNIIGDFVWTSLDYLGEAGLGHVWYDGEYSMLGGYPWNQAFCGDMDLCCFKRPQSYYRDCVWGNSRIPYIAVHKPENNGKIPDIAYWGWYDVVSCWTWPGYENQRMFIDVYCASDEVELFINNKSKGRKRSGKANRYITEFEIEYEPGELVAVGYDNGAETSRAILKTASAPVAIRLLPDKTELKAKFGELSFIEVGVTDVEGNVVYNAFNKINFKVTGAGSLLAVGNGDPKSEEMYTGNQRNLYYGKALIAIRSDGEAGNIIVSAESDDVEPAEIIISVV